jgi:hypothetical protein
MVMSFVGTSVTRTKVGRRKLRLFACGCCRLIWPHLADPRLRNAVVVAERFADGRATAGELRAAQQAARFAERSRGYTPGDPTAGANTAAEMAVSATIRQPHTAAFGMTVYPLPLAGYRGPPARADGLICDLLRDVFGNPFKRVTFEKHWLTDTAVAVARQMYDAHDFSAMPILADALQDAGCDSAAVLDHCRAPDGVHVRGCWVVDLVLGNG